MSLHDVIESRVLGAFRLIDNPTQAVIKRPLNVSAANTTFIRNRSYHYVISNTAGLDHHVEAFSEPPPTPPLGDIDIDINVHDPMHRYLPRITTIELPRDPHPDHAESDGIQSLNPEKFLQVMQKLNTFVEAAGRTMKTGGSI